MPAPTDNRVSLSAEREHDRIVSLEQAAELCSLSADTIKRRYRDKLVQLSPRRVGIRVRDALMLESA
jgi:predicted DNA-binding transcriptional regulator AlpA